MFTFSLIATDKKSRARAGAFVTAHGVLKTPALAMVATDGVIKSVDKTHIFSIPNQYLISNTFHIFTKGILEHIEEAGGIHTYMNAENKVIATDSGGFQVFSLGFGKSHGVGKIAAMFPEEKPFVTSHSFLDSDNPLIITDDGVTFTFDNKPITLTPEISLDIQHRIGADIMFAFDECTSPLNSKQYTEQALERTHAWIKRCINYHNNVKKPRSKNTPPTTSLSRGGTKGGVQLSNPQALFGIIQGGAYKELREKSARYFAQLDVPGYGIGGSLGKSKQEMHQILDWIIPLLPDEKPRHLLGIGQVRDMFECVERGIDLFDCVIPTREARHKVLYTKKGKFPMRKLKTFNEPLLFDYETYGLDKPVTFVDLYKLFLSKDPRAYTFATLHNMTFFAELMKEIREGLQEGRYEEIKEKYLSVY